MSYKPKVLTVSEGGTGSTSYTAYTPICGGTTSTENFQSVSSLGNSGEVLTSNGAGALPSFQALSSSGLGVNFTVVTQESAASVADGAILSMTQGLTFNSNSYTGTSNASQKFIFPVPGTITKCYGLVYVRGTLATTESVSIDLYVNDINTENIASVTFNAASVTVTNSSMSTAISAGDYIGIIVTCPTWATNPTLVAASFTLYLT